MIATEFEGWSAGDRLKRRSFLAFASVLGRGLSHVAAELAGKVAMVVKSRLEGDGGHGLVGAN